MVPGGECEGYWGQAGELGVLVLAGVIMSAKAKQNRDEWETKLIACKESLVQVSQKIPLNKRSVTKKLAELTHIWGKLQTSHSVYCRAAGIGLTYREQGFLERGWKFKRRLGQSCRNCFG